MSEPTVAAKSAMIMELEAGDYYWCACGRTEDQPFCDGSHEGTDFTPLKFTIDKKKVVPMCMCRHTESPPFCDGAHSKLR
ncbi:Glutamate synthase [NADPH] large chain [hydrothermal vent metagenome]|uniref:Glutamate synthase [NADPH] large chain n=1 Tax=hydrothermal vent metagenome TaxID=652676 RepID=A0A3B0QMP2_9ZZZZ